MDFQAGDVGYIDKSLPHFVENTGDTDLVFLEVFPTPHYEDISLAEWLAHTPSRLVNQHIGTGEDFLTKIAKKEQVITPE
jgi:oxalate decarboxylase